jgi:CheY-like chemotaxis protein
MHTTINGRALTNWSLPLAIRLGRLIIAGDLKSKKIYGVLVVDDSEDDRLSLRNTLEQFPRFKLVHELCDGEAAVDYLTGRDRYHERDACPLPDLVLLDLDMPGMGGFGFLRWLRTQSFPSLTVIVLSNSALPEVMLLSVALGAHGYWSKPASPEMRRLMLLEIETLLDGRAASSPKTRARRAGK